MPFSSLRPQITQRFHEVDVTLTDISSVETTDPLISDPVEVRIRRGLVFVHLYGAFEYSIDQSFIRLAQQITGRAVSSIHLHKPIHSVAMDGHFMAIHDLSDWSKKFRRRVEVLSQMQGSGTVTIRDTVLSLGMQSVDPAVIELAFDLYGIPGPHLVDPSVGGYIKEVVSKRHAVAHGRESPAEIGKMKVNELRKRYAALYKQASYVLDTLSDFITNKKFIAGRHRAKY